MSSSSWSDVNSVCQQYYSSEITHIQEIESVIDTVFSSSTSCSGSALYTAIYNWEHSYHSTTISTQFLSILHVFEQYVQSVETITVTQVHQILIEVIQTGTISTTTSGTTGGVSVTTGGSGPHLVHTFPKVHSTFCPNFQSFIQKTMPIMS